MIGDEHKRAPEQIGAALRQFPERGEAMMKRAGAAHARERIGHADKQLEAFVSERGHGAAEARRIFGGPAGEVGKATRLCGRARWDLRLAGLGLPIVGLRPEQARCVFQSCALGPIDSVDAAIDEAALANGGDGALQNGIAPIDGARGDIGAATAAPAAAHERGNIGGGVEAGTRIVIGRARGNEAAAHISVERLRFDAQTGEGGVSIQPGHMLIVLIKIDVD